jgi:hypothetical protein
MYFSQLNIRQVEYRSRWQNSAGFCLFVSLAKKRYLARKERYFSICKTATPMKFLFSSGIF